MPDESLSSWRQRAGQANGYERFPLMDGELRRIDHDIGNSETVLDWLAWSFSIDVGLLRKLTLTQFSPSVFGVLGNRSHPEWLVRSRYGEIGSAFGPVYCPMCLISDEQPYFRRHWRLGFFTECDLHGCRMQERCNVCGVGVWPSWSTRPASEKWPISFGHCFRCGASLGALAIDYCDSSFAARFTAILHFGHASLSNDFVVPSEEYFRGLSAIASLFLRIRSNRRIRQSSSPSSVLAGLFASSEGNRRLQELDVGQRRALVHEAADLLHEWPKRLVAFCEVTGITAEHFSPHRERMPEWFKGAVDAHLSLQRRGVTDSDVRDAVTRLRAEGQAVTRANLRRQLGADAGAINRLQLRRSAASAEELACVLEATERMLQQHQARSSSYEVVLRNACILMLSILRGSELQAVAVLTAVQVDTAIESLPSHRPVLDAARGALRKWIIEYREWRIGRAALCGSPDGFFLPIRGQGDCVRAAAMFVTRAYASIDPELLRSPVIFKGLLVVSDSRQQALWG